MILVVYDSVREIALELATKLKGSIDEIIDNKKRNLTWIMEPRLGFDPRTYGLRSRRSTELSFPALINL